MFCTISRKVPTSPVINRKTGRLYERRLIEKALVETGGKCPETDDIISETDLIPLRGSHPIDKPLIAKAADLTSIPALLSHLQNQWDAAEVEQQYLRRALRETHQELATALYRVDAAHRVIARLRGDLPTGTSETNAAATSGVEKETDTESIQVDGKDKPTAKENGVSKNTTPPAQAGSKQQTVEVPKNVSNVPDGSNKTADENPKSSLNPAAVAKTESGAAEKDSSDISKIKQSDSSPTSEDDVPSAWSADLISSVAKLEVELFTKRKGRKAPPNWTPSDDIARVSVTASAPRAAPGAVRSVVVVDDTVYAGWASGHVGAFALSDLSSRGQATGAHAGDRGGTRHVWADSHTPDRVFSGGADGAVRVWDAAAWSSKGKMADAAELGGVVGLQRHPLGNIGLVARQHGWEWADFGTLATMMRRRCDDGARLSCAAVHPDGRLLALGRGDGVVELFDGVRGRVANRVGEAGGEVRAMAMSERGYQMAVCDGMTIKFWDLRKITLAGEVNLGGRMAGVALDGMGEYGVCVGEDVAALFQGKKRTKVLARIALEGDDGVSNVDDEGALGVGWASLGAAAVVGGADGSLHKVGLS